VHAARYFGNTKKGECTKWESVSWRDLSLGAWDFVNYKLLGEINLPARREAGKMDCVACPSEEETKGKWLRSRASEERERERTF
jgi:hypothetical protein